MSADTSSGTIPDGWKTAAIGDVCKVVSGSTPKTSVSKYWGGDIPWLTPNDLSKNRSKVVNHGERSITQNGFDSCSTQMVPEGAVLFTSRAPIGYVAIAGTPMCTNQGFKSAVPNEDIGTEFLYWQLQNLTDDIRSRASGTTFLEISGRGFAATTLVVPPLKEQEKIVEILEEQLSRLDAALASIKITKIKIEKLRGSLIEASLNGDTTTDFVDNWEMKLLGDLVDRKSDIVDGPFGSNLKSEHYVAAGARVIRLQNIGYGDFRNEKAFITEEHFERLKKHDAVEGDLLFASLGERLPRTCLMPNIDAPAIVKADCIRIRLSPRVNNRFVLYATQSPTARVWASEQLHGLGRPRLGLGNIREFPIRIPSLEAQNRIVNFLDEQFSRLEASLAVANAIEKKASTLRRSLLHAAFTGVLTKEWREGAHV